MRLVLLALASLSFQNSGCIELTFMMRDQSVECFHEVIQENLSVNVEFQVIAGGSNDIDCSVKDPGENYIYNRQRIHLDTIAFKTHREGTYSICFGNEFSTFSHKVVYMRFKVGDEAPHSGLGNNTTVMTQIETSLQGIHETLSILLQNQTHHRLREAQGRKRAEELNWRVTWWGFLETLLVLIVCTGQVLIVKNFFSSSSMV